MSQPSELNIYFVLPKEDVDAECSKDMYEAFRWVKNCKGRPKWLLPSECVSHSTSSSDVFVFDQFTGPAFEKLKGDRLKVLGAKCMLQCLSSGDTIPPGDSPIFTQGMRGMIICCTGFDGEKKKILQEKVEHMGGIFHPTLRSILTHVVAQNNISAKAIEAYNAKQPIYRIEWVDAVWKRSLDANVRGSDAEFAKYLSPLFHNLKITTSGISKRRKDGIKQLISEHGGLFTGQLEMNLTDVLIIETPDGDKYDAAVGWKIPCVKSSWLKKCVELNKIVPFREYSVSKKNQASTPKKGDTVNFTGNFSTVSVIEAEEHPLHHVDESSNITSSQPFSVPNSDLLAEKVDKIFIDALKAGQFLDGCNIYLSGFSQNLAEKLRKILNIGGATRFDELSRSVTHIIVPRLCGESLKDTTAYILPIEWLIKSVALKKPAPVEEHLLNCKVATNAFAPPSPLSKQSARLLSRPEPKNLQLAIEENPEEPPQLALDDDLAYRYQQSQQGEPISQRVVRNTSLNSSFSNCSKSGSSRLNHKLFSGLKFFVSEGLTPDELKQCTKLVMKHDGVVVSKRFSGVPDYAVVPLSGGSLADVTPLEIVNLMFLQECIELGDIVPLQYYHKPFTYVTGSKPLEGCVICVSKYVRCERDFIESVIETLGGNVQAVLAKLPKGENLKTTHLICASPSGTKYDAAVRWGLAVVHHDWLFKCAETGTRVPQDPYLVTKSYSGCESSTATERLSPEVKLKSIGHGKIPQEEEEETGETAPVEVIEPQSPEKPLTPRTAVFEVVKTPLEVSRSGTPLLHSQSCHRAVERLRNAETPKFSQSPDMNRTLTPATPYGACFGIDNPSPKMRKRLINWINSGADHAVDPPRKRHANSQHRDSPPFSRMISDMLKSIVRRPEDQPPDDSPEISSSRQQPFAVIDNENIMMKMKEIEESYSRTTPQISSPVPVSNEPKMLIVAESQPHTEIGWDDPSDRDFALASLEQEEKNQPEKFFMFSGLSDTAESAKQLITDSKGRVSLLPHFDKSATHLIAATNMTRAEKLLGSIAAGLWVLHPSYLKQLAIVKDVNALNEEDYEWGNPNIKMPLDALSANVRDCVVIAYNWRCEIQKTKMNRPFANMRFVLLISAAKKDVFARLLDAGGGEIATSDIFGSIKKTFCICEMSALPSKKDMENYAKNGVCCVTTLFISDVILRKETAMKDNMVVDFQEIWERYN